MGLSSSHGALPSHVQPGCPAGVWHLGCWEHPELQQGLDLLSFVLASPGSVSCVTNLPAPSEGQLCELQHQLEDQLVHAVPGPFGGGAEGGKERAPPSTPFYLPLLHIRLSVPTTRWPLHPSSLPLTPELAPHPTPAVCFDHFFSPWLRAAVTSLAKGGVRGLGMPFSTLGWPDFFPSCFVFWIFFEIRSRFF